MITPLINKNPGINIFDKVVLNNQLKHKKEMIICESNRNIFYNKYRVSYLINSKKI